LRICQGVDDALNGGRLCKILAKDSMMKLGLLPSVWGIYILRSETLKLMLETHFYTCVERDTA
jgi:hypothetical protein